MDIGFIARCPTCQELTAIPKRTPLVWTCGNCDAEFFVMDNVAQLIPLKPGDEVTILAGEMTGRAGTVMAVFPDGDKGEPPQASIRLIANAPTVRVPLSSLRLDAITVADGGRERRVPVHYPADWRMVNWENWREAIERIGPGDTDIFADGVSRILADMRADIAGSRPAAFGVFRLERGSGGEACNVWALLASAIGGYQPLAISIDDSDGDRVITLRLEPEAAAETEQTA